MLWPLFADNVVQQTCSTPAWSLLSERSSWCNITVRTGCLLRRWSQSARPPCDGDWCVIDRWPCSCPPPEETLKPNKCWIRQGDPHIDINQLFTYLRWLAKSSSAAFSYAPDRHAFCRRGMEWARLLPCVWSYSCGELTLRTVTVRHRTAIKWVSGSYCLHYSH